VLFSLLVITPTMATKEEGAFFIVGDNTNNSERKKTQ
jgi:hypothetical protein